MCDDFNGADIAGMIRFTVSFVLQDIQDEDQVIITQELLQNGYYMINRIWSMSATGVSSRRVDKH